MNYENTEVQGMCRIQAVSLRIIIGLVALVKCVCVSTYLLSCRLIWAYKYGYFTLFRICGLILRVHNV